MYRVSCNDYEVHLATLREVERLLDLFHEDFRSKPTLVTVERLENDDCLTIGLGSDLSVLNYMRGHKNPPYYTSLGEPSAEGVIGFIFGGELTDFRLRNAVPVSAARAALTRFCETGELPEEVGWEMD